MLIVVSPYHLTSREPPALASLLLAEQVVTLLPTPRVARSGGVSQADLRAAARENPRYHELMEEWRWLMPLWEAGLIADTLEGIDPAEDVRRAAGRLAEEAAFDALRPFMRTELFDDDERSLQFIASDLLKGGPDPAITVPVLAGLDAYAARVGILVARSSATSIAQKAELEMASKLGAVAVPVLLQASAERLLDARERLNLELTDLREAIGSVIDGSDVSALQDAARRYHNAFELEREALCEVDDPDDVRVVCGMVALMIAELPVDAVLRSSSLAAGAVTGVRGRPRGSRSVAPQTLPVVADPSSSGRIRTLVFKPIGR